MTVEKSSISDSTALMEGDPVPDVSAMEALEDDADEWEPIVLTTLTATASECETEEKNGHRRQGQAGINTSQSTTTASIDAENLTEMLQAVDALLEVETDSAAPSTTSETAAELAGVVGVASGGSASTTATTSAAASSAATSATEKPPPTTITQATTHPSTSESPPTRSRPRESPLQLRRRLRAARDRLHREALQPVARFSVHTTRKMVTGSHHTRVRDYVTKPHVTRVLDKYLFTGGVLCLLLTEFIFLQFPHLFRYYFIILMLPLLILRVVLFQRTKQQFFLLDYCYWVNGLGFLVALLPAATPSSSSSVSAEATWSTILWQVFFVSANGPLFFAMVAWNNSLVFHSIDKSTSTAIHILPALLSLCERWRNDAALNTQELPWSRHLGYPLLFYATWQTVYLLQTEWLHRASLDADPGLSTSLRYLTTAEKMTINRQTLKLCRSLGIMGPHETFSPPTFKVKLIFVILQALMTLVTFLPTVLFYKSAILHYSVCMAIMTFSIMNGARYYVQVFSRIYEKRYQSENPHHVEEEYVDTAALMTEHAVSAKKEA